MRRRDLETLELPKLLDGLANHAASDAGADRCRRLEPYTAPDDVRRALATLAEYLQLSGEFPQAPRVDAPDIRPLLALAAHDGAVLEPRDLLTILQALRLVGAARGYLERAEPESVGLSAIASRLIYPREIEQAIGGAVDDTGRVRDDASPMLAALRASVRSLRTEVETRLAQLLADAGEDFAIEDYVTLRNNRFVVPVRTSAAHRIEGVIQDRSQSGETVFLEPLFAVELNNRMVLAAKEEEAEARRICANLTERIRETRDDIAAAFDVLLDYDVLMARAALARHLDATIPAIGAGDLRLLGCRHPLLALGGRAVTAVDLILEDGCRGLIITGPNTGGKTVALKTIGLFAVMAQCGLAIPAAEGSTLPCFSSIYADIGDAQSIERNLSTFSAHMENLADITRHVDANSLALLDEPGVGTDPAEGAALAVALLAYVHDRGAFVAASSHSGEVKTFALARPGFDVAAVDVDPMTAEPRYVLRYHALGQSLAFPMARRLNVPEPIISAAEQHVLGTAGPDVARAAKRLEETQRAFETKIAALDAERAALAASQATESALVADLQAKQRAGWHSSLVEAREFLRELRSEGARVLEELRRTPAPRTTLKQAVAAQEAAIAAATATHDTDHGRTDVPPAVGDEVEVVDQGIRGELVELRGERARIQRGGLRFEVPAAALRRVGHGAAGNARRKQPGAARAQIRLAEIPDATGELSLVGLRTREALRQLEDFLDRAVRAGMPSVRIIHGIGTGALRRAVHEYLETTPYCAGFHEAHSAAGGAGVTVAELDSNRR
jgi:DNA mismatch repair protein MutS2